MSHVDLSALHIEQQRTALPPRPLGPRLLAAAAVLLLLAVGATFVWPLLRSVRQVPMASVRAANAPGAATTLAEAVGWVEADPFAVAVRPLVAGRVESIAVLEGTAVKGSETVIATLASAALQAACDRATAMLVEREAMVTAAVAAHELAQARLAQRAEARAASLEATAQVAEKGARLAMARSGVLRAGADARAAAAALTAHEQLHVLGDHPPLALERARAAAAAADAAVSTANAEVQGLERELAAATAKLALARELLEKPVDLEGAVAIAKADVEKARAAVASARTDCDISKRELAWATVRAPVHGVVLRLLTAPGASVGPEGDAILLLYDPKRLRARIDVPLGSIGSITEGQGVELRSEVTGSTVIRGVVQRLQQESDLLKNTLQVKVQLLDPPPLLRPETLCRARFLGGETVPTAVAAFMVPKAALRGDAVFVFDPSRERARAVPVQVVHEQGDDVVVRGELSVTQKVVLVAVVDGESIREQLVTGGGR
ncbi:MAG TPA: HlyD family efflux transporter periplasmic adaptor subunit [Planctomycetota bacterium]|nr:HlyD family efflux transporter periplasmic adaptor subunit [Planctomycetota bacterium]